MTLAQFRRRRKTDLPEWHYARPKPERNTPNTEPKKLSATLRGGKGEADGDKRRENQIKTARSSEKTSGGDQSRTQVKPYGGERHKECFLGTMGRFPAVIFHRGILWINLNAR